MTTFTRGRMASALALVRLFAGAVTPSFALDPTRRITQYGMQEAGLSRVRDRRVATLTSRDGLSNSTVLALLPTRGGSLWIGTRSGVDLWRG